MAYLNNTMGFFFFKVLGMAFKAFKKFYFIFWLCGVFFALCGLPLVVASGGFSSSQRTGFEVCGLAAPGRGRCRSRLTSFVAPGRSNLYPLSWQADSYPLHHWGSPVLSFE